MIYGWESLIVIHHPDKFDDLRNCGSGNIMFLVVEGQDSTWPYFNPPLLLTFKVHLTHKVLGLRHSS